VVLGLAEWGTCIRTVSCDYDHTATLAYQNNTIATGLHRDIIIFDALTGSQTAVLSGHTRYIMSLAFSPDGTLLVSGDTGGTVKLWDVQTGGVIKNFHGHTNTVLSVSISVGNTMIASGSKDRTICLWNIGTGECHIIIKGHHDVVKTVSFSPTNSHLLLSTSSDGIVQKWDIGGHQLGPSIAGSCIAFSPDGTQFISCKGAAITIQDTGSGATVGKFHLTHAEPNHCCFSPNGRFIACAAGHTIYLWDITGLDPCLIKILVGHTAEITSLIFPSLTLISASEDRSVKFWEISTPSANLVAPHVEPISLTPAPIRAVSLQAKDGLAFSVDLAGVVKTWSILTGLCKESCETQAKDIHGGDVQLIDGQLIIVGYKEVPDQDWVAHVWNAEKGELQTMGGIEYRPRGLRISGDGSRILCVDNHVIQTWSIQTGKPAGKGLLGPKYPYHLDPLWIAGSKVLVRCGKSSTLGWDFGILGSTPIKISPTSSDRPQLDFIGITSQSNTSQIGIEDRVTGNVVFQLSSGKPLAAQWDGRYLIAGYESGEISILDFGHMLPQ